MKKKKEYEEEINPYEVDKLSKIPSGLIIIIMKYWAAAAASYFIAIGGMEIGLITSVAESDNPLLDFANNLEVSIKLILMISLFLALILNYGVRILVRMLYNRRNDTYVYNMVNCKGFKSFIFALLYSLVVTFIMYMIINLLSHWNIVINPFGAGYSNKGIEPFAYGLIFIVVDGLFVSIKNLLVMARERHVYKVQMQGE